MNVFWNYVIVIVAVWFTGFATAMIVGQHSRYLSFTKRQFKKVWTTNKTRIIWFAVGFGLAIALLNK